MKKIWLVFVLFCLACVLAPAQTTRVRGTVTDAETGEPIPFVGVYFDGTTIGISTDLEGHYLKGTTALKPAPPTPIFSPPS